MRAVHARLDLDRIRTPAAVFARERRAAHEMIEAHAQRARDRTGSACESRKSRSTRRRPNRRQRFRTKDAGRRCRYRRDMWMPRASGAIQVHERGHARAERCASPSASASSTGICDVVHADPVERAGQSAAALRPATSGIARSVFFVRTCDFSSGCRMHASAVVAICGRHGGASIAYQLCRPRRCVHPRERRAARQADQIVPIDGRRCASASAARGSGARAALVRGVSRMPGLRRKRRTGAAPFLRDRRTRHRGPSASRATPRRLRAICRRDRRAQDGAREQIERQRQAAIAQCVGQNSRLAQRA